MWRSLWRFAYITVDPAVLRGEPDSSKRGPRLCHDGAKHAQSRGRIPTHTEGHMDVKIPGIFLASSSNLKPHPIAFSPDHLPS